MTQDKITNQDTADEGIPAVRENRTTELVDIPDKLPCEWCDGKEKDIYKTGNPEVYLEEYLGDWYLTYVYSDYHSISNDSVIINYCPNCGQKLDWSEE